MKKKRVAKIQRWLAELGPVGDALGGLISHVDEVRGSGGSVALEDAQGSLNVLSVRTVLDHLGGFGAEASAMAGMLGRMYEKSRTGMGFSPLSSLGGLIIRLALDDDLREAYLADPQSVMAEARLSEEEKKLLKDGDWQFIKDVFGWAEYGHSITNPPGYP